MISLFNANSELEIIALLAFVQYIDNVRSVV